MRVIWTDPTPEDSCPVCKFFGGMVFESDDGLLPLPAHPHCECYYRPDMDDTAVSVWDWDSVDGNIKAFWIRRAAWALREGEILDGPLAELEEEAMAINEEREENLGAGEGGLIRAESQRMHLAAGKGVREYKGVMIAAGRIRNMLGEDGHLFVEAEAIRQAVNDGLFEGLACFIDHADWDGPSLRDLFGAWHSVEYDEAAEAAVGTLRYYRNDVNEPVAQQLDQILADREAGISTPETGVSLVFYAKFRPRDEEGGPLRIMAFRKVDSADLVFYQAVRRARIVEALQAQNSQRGGNLMAEENEVVEEGTAPVELEAGGDSLVGQVTPAGDVVRVDEWTRAIQETAVRSMLNAADLPEPTRLRLEAGSYNTPDEVQAAIEAARVELAALQESEVINLGNRPVGRGGRQRVEVVDPRDVAQAHLDWFFGVEGAASPPANYRRLDALYVAMTGDVEFYGRYDEDRVTLAGANTTDLADMAANAMNKVIVQQWSHLSAWRWYEKVAYPTPNDGSVQDMQWTVLGGIANLPTVAEGGVYTELTMGDVAEKDSFVKSGGYVGITLEMIRNSDIMRIQAVPRALAVAAVRSRSATIANIFTANSGVGPTLDQDSTALFDATHNNVAVTAFDLTAWRAARTECFKHTEVTSGKALGVFPRYWLGPADLYDTALSTFGYGEGMPTTYLPEAEDRGFADPRPIPLAVPDFTDANDWAYIVDPQVFPVIHISYAQAPGGGVHPVPELFSQPAPTIGMNFTNDKLPVKVRDWFSAGVNGYRGIGKRNVV